METEKQLFKGSPSAVAYFKRSVEFFSERDITQVCYNLIPDALLGSWVAPDPQQLLSDMADGKAEPDSTLPFAVYSCAYGYHDRIYAAAQNDESYKTPTETMIKNFFLFQEILHFNIYPETLLQFRDAVRKLGVALNIRPIQRPKPDGAIRPAFILT